jgi:hypothetical protein
MPEPTPSIHVKVIPEDVFKLIIKKQRDERDNKKKKINLSQAVIMLLKEAYLKN